MAHCNNLNLTSYPCLNSFTVLNVKLGFETLLLKHSLRIGKLESILSEDLNMSATFTLHLSQDSNQADGIRTKCKFDKMQKNDKMQI